ncbi:MAG: ABC transporter permease/substrate-binding protein [Cyclobacteriaceae bacterium]
MKDFFEFVVSHLDEIKSQTLEHLILTVLSMGIASIIGVATGIVLNRTEKLSGIVLGFVGIIQTIPSLALLGFLLPIFGIGTVPAIIALFLYGLLPIVRNTYTGIKEIDPAIRDASLGMGMTNIQLLRYVELPLALPVILAGIRTATVINVGIATLCALIAAGGLGEFIFRGISLNNQNMILAGAIPASMLALVLDFSIGFLQRHSGSKKAWALSGVIIFSLVLFVSVSTKDNQSRLIAGFNSEFIERADGFKGLDSAYNLPVEIKEMEISLMYRSLYNGDVDLIDGFITDGRVKEFNLLSLEDDKHYFPPYFAAPLVNGEALRKYPAIKEALEVLGGTLSNEKMAELNYLVDGEKKEMSAVANQFLKELNIYADPNAGTSRSPDIIIGSKAFTENFLLAHIFAQIIESRANLKTRLELGFGGTKLIFDALRLGEIDVYPEYTGTGFLVLLQKNASEVSDFTNPEVIYQEVKKEFEGKHDLHWLAPLGFNNTFAIMMRTQQADSLHIESITDLSNYLQGK